VKILNTDPRGIPRQGPKEFEKFLAMKREKEMRKKRRAKFDDDDRSE